MGRKANAVTLCYGRNLLCLTLLQVWQWLLSDHPGCCLKQGAGSDGGRPMLCEAAVPAVHICLQGMWGGPVRR